MNVLTILAANPGLATFSAIVTILIVYLLYVMVHPEAF